MQLSATTIAAKPLPSDLIPEALSPYILSSCFQSPSRRRCHLSKDGFSCPSDESSARRSPTELTLQNQGLRAIAALDDPRWFGRVALLMFLSCYFVKEVQYG